jgi:hypothetical protein
MLTMILHTDYKVCCDEFHDKFNTSVSAKQKKQIQLAKNAWIVGIYKVYSFEICG